MGRELAEAFAHGMEPTCASSATLQGQENLQARLWAAPPQGQLGSPRHGAPYMGDGMGPPMPPAPAAGPMPRMGVRGDLRVNVNLPPVDKLRGTGLTIRAWDPSQDAVLSPREWQEVDPRMSPFPLSAASTPYTNSPISELDVSFQGMGFSAPNTPTGDDGFHPHHLPSPNPQQHPHSQRARARMTKGANAAYDQQQMRGAYMHQPLGGYKSIQSPRSFPQTPPALAGGQGSPRWGMQQAPPHHHGAAMTRNRHAGPMSQNGRRKASGTPTGASFPSPTGSTSSLAAEDYFGGAPQEGGDVDSKRCCNAIKKLCSAGNITEVFAVLEDMMSRGLVPDIKTVKTIMRTCVKKLAWRRALQLLHMDGIPKDVVIYTMAINTCGKAGEWEQGLRILREMDETKGLGPNEVSYGTAISACGKAGRWELALSLLGEMKERGLLLNDVCYGGAIDACGRAGQWQNALKLLHEMTLEGVAPNEVCYNSAISACGKAGEWEKAVALLREMRDRGLTPDELNYNSAISACGKAAQWAHAVRLLREMATQGLSPDVVSYGAAIDACRKAGKFERGLSLLKEMKDVGLAPNEVCYHSAVTACSEAGRWSEALLVLSDMMKQGLKPDAISYNAAVEACAKAGKWEALIVLLQETGRDSDLTLVEAVYNNGIVTAAKYHNATLSTTILNEMEFRGLSPTSASYAAVIESCSRVQQWDVVLSKMDGMRDKGLIPDAATYNASVRACGHMDKWNKAMSLLTEMKTRAYSVDQATYSVIINTCASSGEWQQVLALMRDMSVDGNSDAQHYGAAINACSKAGQWEHTLSLLQRMARSESSTTASLSVASTPHSSLPCTPVLMSPSTSTFNSNSDPESYFRVPYHQLMMVDSPRGPPSLMGMGGSNNSLGSDQSSGVDSQVSPPVSLEGDDGSGNNSLFSFDWMK